MNRRKTFVIGCVALVGTFWLAILSGLVLVSTGVARADPPDFTICDGLSAAARGLCRAGVAVGCADDPSTGNPEACMSIEDNYAAVTGEDPPWIAPPLPPCPCDYGMVPQTEANWTTGVTGTFAEILFVCSGGIRPSAGFSAWDGTEFNVGAQIITDTGPNLCSFFTSELAGEVIEELTDEEVLACRHEIIDYAAAFTALFPDVPVNDRCTPTL